jgi:hypothetical protein
MMEGIFKETKRFDSDFYVGDYTQYAETHADCQYSGVTISDVSLPDIKSLRFINKQHVPVLAINFEKNLGYFRNKKGELVSNCECMLVSDRARKKGWLILAELKYCGGNPRVVNENFEIALAQVKDTFLFLRDQKQLFGVEDYRYIWVVSLPEHDDLIPFSQFYPSPERILEYKEKLHVNLISSNVIEIRTHQHVRIED